MKLRKIISLLLITNFFFISCGQDQNEKVADAILRASIFLNQGSCQEAIDVLEEIGRQDDHAYYIRTLATAYACRAGYSSAKLFQDDIGLIGDPSTLGGMARFSTSSAMDAADNDAYEDIQTAIDILLYAGGISRSKDPTVARRAAVFNSDELAELHSLALYLIIVNMGKYVYYYGNSSTAGVKGAGSGTNTCLGSGTTGYEDIGGTLQLYVTTNGGACDAGETGSSDLGTPNALTSTHIARRCQGVVLFNNFLTLLPLVLADASGNDFDDLNTALTAVTAAQTALLTAHPTATDVVNVLSQSKCESDNAASDDNLQVHFVFYYETLFQ